MEKGPIIYLNGITSTGKSSIAEALRQCSGVDFYYLADDIFEDNIIDIPEYGTTAYWKKLAEAVFLMYHTARLFSDHGKTVVIDSMLLELEPFAPHYERMTEIFGDHPLFIVDVHCPLEICRQRNLLRGDRYETQSQEQANVMAQNVRYDLRLDTSILSPDQCAQKIVTALYNGAM